MTNQDEYQTVCPACGGPLNVVTLGLTCDIPLTRDGFYLADSKVETFGEAVSCSSCKFHISGLPMGPWVLIGRVRMYKDGHHKLIVTAKCDHWEGPVSTYDIQGKMTRYMLRSIARAILEVQVKIVKAERYKIDIVDWTDLKE